MPRLLRPAGWCLRIHRAGCPNPGGCSPLDVGVGVSPALCAGWLARYPESRTRWCHLAVICWLPFCGSTTVSDTPGILFITPRPLCRALIATPTGAADGRHVLAGGARGFAPFAAGLAGLIARERMCSALLMS